MTKRLTWAFVIAVALTALANAPADARQHKKHHTHIALAVTHGCIPDNDGRQHCGGSIHRASESPMGRRIVAPSNGYDLAGVVYIPNPSGTWRVAQSCAHRLAAFWGLGKGLDKVSTWPHVFARTFSPSIGVAAVRRDLHHVMGIIGGGPGAWRVADFNSGGHLNREYTIADFKGYFFVDPRTRVAHL